MSSAHITSPKEKSSWRIFLTTAEIAQNAEPVKKEKENNLSSKNSPIYITIDPK